MTDAHNIAPWPALVAVDVEGNGAKPPDLIEVSVMPIVDRAPVPDRARTWLIKPPRPIGPIALSIHGISNDMVRDAPTWAQVSDEIRAALGGAWMVAHSASVEYNVLTAHFGDAWQPAGVIDTLRLARATWPNVAGGYGLDSLIQHAGINTGTISGTRHRAGYDAHAAALLFLELAQSYTNWPSLAAAAVPPNKPGHPALSQPAPTTSTETLW